MRYLLFLIIFLLTTVTLSAQSNTCANNDQLVIDTSTKTYKCIMPGSQPAGTGTTMLVANDTVTGTTVNKFAKLTGAPSKAIVSSNGDIDSAIGIVTNGAGTTGNATITILGQVSCVFDGATTAGDYVTIAATGGGCHDAGSAYPTSGATYGRVLSTNGAGGTFVMELMTPDIAFQNAGSGKSKPAGSAAEFQYRDSNQFGAGNLFRIDANTVAQKNSTTAQRFELFKSTTNNQRLSFYNSGSEYRIESEDNAGSGNTVSIGYTAGNRILFGSTDVSPSTSSISFGNTTRWGSAVFTEADISADNRYRWSGRTELYSTANGNLQISGNGSNKGLGLELIIGDTSATGGTRLQRVVSTTPLRIRSGDDNNFAFIVSAGNEFVSTQFDKTNATLANVTELVSEALLAGKTYVFNAELFVDADITGGSKYAIAGTATATAIKYHIDMICDATNLLVITSRQTALAGSAGQAGCTAGLTKISGTITVNAGGTLAVQFAQNAANGTSSVLTMSKFEVRQLN